MRRVFLCLAILAMLALPSPASAYQWRGHIVTVWDSTPFPAMVDDVFANYTVPGLSFVIERRDQCQSRRGILSICAEYYPPGQAPASWAEPKLNGSKDWIVSAVVYLNTGTQIFSDPSPALDPTRQMLICHETGGALGLIEAAWPVYNPDGTLDEYHHGCMNLIFNTPYPSPYDLDTLRALYGS